jgi:uroporphyrinogen decarboxylase
MSKDAMSPRERWLAVLNRKKPDRVPMDYWATPEATAKLLKACGCADEASLFRKLHIDRPVTVVPAYVGPAVPDDADVFGCRYRDMRYATGVYRECIHHPLAEFATLEELKKGYRWPSPDWWDCTALPAQVAAFPDAPVRGGGSEPFLTYKDLRGGEQAFIDLIENPEIVHYCLDRLYDLAYEGTRRIYEALPGQVNISYVAEDMGSQDDLMYSPAQIREFFIPRMKRMIDLAHQAGVFVFHHSDGGVRRIIPDMIQAGIDVLNPIQWRCGGMEREGLKRDFGERLIFHGGVDNQRTLPFGTVDDVRAEVRDNLSILGAGGGYILAPCHNIQAVSPAENIVALYETGYHIGDGNF